MRVRNLAQRVLPIALLLACGGSRSQPVTVEVGELEISVRAEPADLRVGENTLWLELRDAGGAPITDAELGVRVHMHAMGAMPAMGGPAAISELGGGRYRADFALDMGSTWLVEIEAAPRDGEAARAEGSLTVGTPGLRLEGVGGASPAPAEQEATRRGDSAGERHPAEFQLPLARLQRVGVLSAPAQRRELATTLRAVGRVVVDETTLEDVALRVRGWVGEVHVDAVGAPVERGDVLFTLYSPELYAAQEEYLQALRSRERARETSAPDRADYLVSAARRRLQLWGVAGPELERIVRRGEPVEYLPVRSSISGHVLEKNLVAGSAFAAGQRLYRIAPLGRVWIEAEVYEQELPLVHEGQAATVTLPYAPERSFEARVAYVYPTLDPATRTLRVRLELPNPGLLLRPEMYASVRLRAERGERLVVPQSAVLHTGERSFVFRALGDGRFRPQQVEVGLRSGDDVEILSGLEAGDPVVTSGTFLIASESRLRAALEQW